MPPNTHPMFAPILSRIYGTQKLTMKAVTTLESISKEKLG